MTTKIIIGATVVGLLASLAAAYASSDTASVKRPNLLLIITDDQGLEMSCMGTPGMATPNLDALARRGLLLRNVYNTYASCSPSRASILTGTYPHTHHITINVPEFFGPMPPSGSQKKGKTGDASAPDLAVPANITTLPEVLKQAGYRTGISHKFHIQPHAKFPFDVWIADAAGAKGVPASGGDSYEVRLGKFFADTGGKPFFLMHNIGAPHRPFAAHIRRAKTKPVDPAKVELPAFLPDVSAVRQDWADYLTATQEADYQVGEIIEILRKTGKLDNTLIMVGGDNGPAFTRGKASTYPLGAREALVIAGPGVALGKESRELVSYSDIAPTLLDFAGLPVPASVQGRTLRPLLEQRPGAKGHPLIVCEKQGRGTGPDVYLERGAFDGRYHYIRRMNPAAPRDINADNFQEKPWGNRTYPATLAAKDTFPKPYALMLAWKEGLASEELFDLQNDPWATRDISKDPAGASALAQMRQALDDWQERTGDRQMIRSSKLNSL
jgi:N-sulfoglucosamine sulfohydrolase